MQGENSRLWMARTVTLPVLAGGMTLSLALWVLVHRHTLTIILFMFLIYDTQQLAGKMHFDKISDTMYRKSPR